MSTEPKAAVALPTDEEVAAALSLVNEATEAVALAKDALREAEDRYNELVSQRPTNTPLHAAVSDFFARQDELAANRHAAAMDAAALAAVVPVNAPSVLDASRQIAAKTKKRGAAPAA